MRKPATGVPVYRPDIYSTDGIVDPYPHYARLRQLGPVVWLPKHRVYALPRFGECKAVLRDDTTFVSGSGVALNAITNRLSRGTTLNSDGAEHDLRRKLVAHRILPRALRAISEYCRGRCARSAKVWTRRRRTSSTPRWANPRSTASPILRPRCRSPWCPTWWAGPATSATI